MCELSPIKITKRQRTYLTRKRFCMGRPMLLQSGACFSENNQSLGVTAVFKLSLQERIVLCGRVVSRLTNCLLRKRKKVHKKKAFKSFRRSG